MKYKIHKEKICQRSRSAIIWLPGERADSGEADDDHGDEDDDDGYEDELLTEGGIYGDFESKHFSSIGNYKLTTTTLGKGSFSKVVLADHVILKKQVALKVMTLSKIKDPYVWKTLKREADIMTKLDHPNIVTLHEVGHVPLHLEDNLPRSFLLVTSTAWFWTSILVATSATWSATRTTTSWTRSFPG